MAYHGIDTVAGVDYGCQHVMPRLEHVALAFDSVRHCLCDFTKDYSFRFANGTQALHMRIYSQDFMYTEAMKSFILHPIATSSPQSLSNDAISAALRSPMACWPDDLVPTQMPR